MDKPTTSPPTRPVLVNASVILAMPADETELWDRRLLAVAERLHRAVEQAFTADPDLEEVGGTSFHYLDDGSENARRCERCSRWAADVDQSDRLDGLDCGSIVGERFLCEQCRAHLIGIGELPDPITGRRRPTG